MPTLANKTSLRLLRLKRMLVRVVAGAGALCIAGCAMPISPIHASAGDGDDITGSIPKPGPVLSRQLDAEDWRRARAALGTALDPQGNGSLVTWENLQSGAKGTFVPVAQIYPSDDKICRAFLAKVETPAGTEDVQGTACRDSGPDWTLRDARPWTRS